MARYRTIDVRIWGDQKFRTLSPPQPNAQTLWVYLLAGEHTGCLPGLSRVGEQALSEELGWPLRDLRRCWAEIADKGMAFADWGARVVWVPNRIRYAGPENPNVVKSWRAAWDEIPECPLKVEAWRAFSAHMSARDDKARARALAKQKDDPGPVFTEALEESCPNPSGDPSPNGYGKGFAKGSVNGMANQEQEQEQEQDLIPPTPPRGGADGGTGPKPTRAERKQAEQVRHAWGRCLHEPRCASSVACIAAIVRGWREQATHAAGAEAGAAAGAALGASVEVWGGGHARASPAAGAADEDERAENIA
jgi:hypothetical protein